MKRTLQVIIAVLSVLPLAVGTLGFIFGAGLFLPAGMATPKLDSQFRFLSAWDVGLALVVWWIIPQIEYQTALFRIVRLAVFLGGVGRVIAWYLTRSPGTAFLVVTVSWVITISLANGESRFELPGSDASWHVVNLVVACMQAVVGGACLVGVLRYDRRSVLSAEAA